MHHPQDELPGLLLGELPPSTAIAVDQHLAGCDPCRRDLAAVAVAASALRDASRLPVVPAPDLPPFRPPAAVPVAAPADERDLSGLPPSVLRDRRRRSRWLLGAAAVLVVLLLGVGGYTAGRDRDTARGQTVALAATAGSATAEARMRGAGDDQIMTMSTRGLPRPRPAPTTRSGWSTTPARSSRSACSPPTAKASGACPRTWPPATG